MVICFILINICYLLVKFVIFVLSIVNMMWILTIMDTDNTLVNSLKNETMNGNRTKTIFLIDDDNLTNYVNKRLMMKSGFDLSVHTFDSPDVALNALKRLLVTDWDALPDVILLDINMPVMDGWDFLMEYEKIMPQSETKIFMLSSSLNQEDMNRAARFNMVSGFLPKPLKAEQLYELLEAMVIAA